MYANIFLGIISYFQNISLNLSTVTLSRRTKKRNKRCRLTVSPELRAYPSLAYQFALPIGSPYADIYSKYKTIFSETLLQFISYYLYLILLISRAELFMWANGMVEYGRKFFKSTNECRLETKPKAKTRTLTLFDLSAAFFILGIGISLSAFASLLNFCPSILIIKPE